MNKYIFLDFDGVLTTRESKYRLREDKLSLLGKILDATNADIVISSSWRRGTVADTIKYLSTPTEYYMNGISFPYSERIVGITPRLITQTYEGESITTPRGVEILYWLKNYGEESNNYVILDDDSGMLYWQRKHFIHTNHDTGLTEEDVSQAVRILNMEVI